MPFLAFRKPKSDPDFSPPAKGGYRVDIPLESLSRPVPLELLAYWRELARRRLPPLKSDFDPLSALPKATPFLCLLEPLDAERSDFRIRLVGQGVIDRYGMNATGMALSDYTTDGFAVLRHGMCVALDERRPVAYSGDYRRVERGHISVEGVLCPLEGQRGGFIVAGVGFES